MNKFQPPRYTDRLLEWFCDPHLLEEVQGDLHELYGKWVNKYGEKKARWLYAIHAIKFFRPYSIKKLSINDPTIMFINYLIIALRTLLKQKLYSFINIGGLAVGLTCFILIFLFVQYELSFDRFYNNADRIFRIVQQQPSNYYLGSNYFAVTPAPLAHTLLEEYPEVKATTTLVRPESALLSLNDDHYLENGIGADENFFQVFNLPLLRGKPETALTQPHSIVVTKSLANKIFGDKDPMGQILLYQHKTPYKVTGVMTDVPQNSHFTFEFITDLQSQSQYAKGLAEQQWMLNAWLTYIVLTEDADANQFRKKIGTLADKYLYADKKDLPATRTHFEMQALTDIHLYSHINAEFEINGDIQYVYLFSAIALVVLMLSCINYTNLAVTRSIKRAHEVGIRKAIGANYKQLICQFLGESVLMTFMAFLLALVFVQLLLPFFENLVDRPIEFNFRENEWLLPGLLALVVIVGLLSGSYPAFFMASLQPSKVLKGKIKNTIGRFSLQRLLILGQFAISMILVISSFVIYNQLHFIQHKKLGYSKEQLVVVQVRDNSLANSYSAIRNEWLRNPNIISITSSGNLPTNVKASTTISGWDGSIEDENLPIYPLETNFDFLQVFGISLAAGRTFSPEVATDTMGACLINETAAHNLGWTPEEALGKHFKRMGAKKEHTVIGVIKDFHMHSMHMPIEPLVIYLDPESISYISAKVLPDNLPETIAFLKKSVNEHSPYPFEYQFLDEYFDQLYKADLGMGKTLDFFTLLALFIASLGLFGLAAFTAEQRTQEVGIRKVLGATVHSIVTLLTSDFLSLVALAFLLATPIAWYAAHRWLQDFAYRIDLQWWMFVLPGIAAFVIALLTVSFQSIKAAIANPVDSLRNE